MDVACTRSQVSTLLSDPEKKSPASLPELKYGDLQAGEHAKTSEHHMAPGSKGEGTCECALSMPVEVGRQMAEPCTLTCT